MTPSVAPSTTTPLSASNPADLLAMTTKMIGYTPTDSLVVIGLQPGSTGAFLRLDLTTALKRPARIADSYAPTLAKSHEACIVLTFTPEAPTAETFSKAAAALAALDQRFTAAGVPVVSAWQIGGGYARALDCPNAECCPYPGQPVGPVGPAARELLAEPAPTPTQELARYTQATPDAHCAEQIAQTVASGSKGLLFFDAVASGETTAEEMTAAELAGLLAGLDTHHAPAVIATTVEGLSAGLTALTARPQVTGIPAVASTYGTAPNWERIDRLAAALATLAPYAEGSTAANLYAIMGWISFAKGQGTLTTLFIDHAKGIDPRNRLVGDIALLSSRRVSGWAQNPSTAYPHQ